MSHHVRSSAFFTVFAAIALGAARLASAALDPPAAGAWTAAPDVLPGALATQPATTAPAAAALAADPYLAKITLNITPTFSFTRDVVAPTRPSKYLLTTSPFFEGFELWDLKTGNKERESTARLDMQSPALSPDGQYLAGIHRAQSAARGPITPLGPSPRGQIPAAPRGMPLEPGPSTNSGPAIDIFSLRTGKTLASLPLPATPGAGAQILGYSGNDLIIVGYRSAVQMNVKIHEIATGKTVGEFTIDRHPGPLTEYALSPTGKYLATALGGTLSLYQVNNGQLLGTLPYRITAGNGEEPADFMDFRSLGTHLAFSPNGQELAILAPGKDKLHAMIVSVPTGQMLEDKMTPAAGLPLESSKPLSWNPDGSSMLWGAVVIDRGTLNVIYQIPKFDLLYARWSDPTHVLVITRPPDAPAARGPQWRLAFETLPISREQLVKAAGTLALGGTLEDASLTPLTSVLLGTAGKTTLEGAPVSPWNIKPADPVKPARTIAPLFPIKTPAGNDSANDFPTAVFFTSLDTHAAFFEHIAKDGDIFHRGQRAKTWIDRRDLAGGAVSATLEIPGSFRTLDASDTGKSLLFLSDKAGDRVDIYISDKAAFKPLAAFRPFGIAKPPMAEGFPSDDPNIITFGALVDDSHVMVMSKGGTLALIEVPSGRSAWMTEIPSKFAHITDRVPALSPDRHLAALCMKDGVCLFNPLTGQALNRFPAGSEIDSPLSATFSPDGQRLAVLNSYHVQLFLDILDLKTGQTAAHFPVGGSGGYTHFDRLFFLSPAYVMYDVGVGAGESRIGMVVSIERKQALWEYSFPALQFGSVMPYDNFFVGAAPDSRAPAAVGAIALPHPDVIKMASTLSDEDLYIWHPGMSVRLDITVVGDEAYRKEQINRWTESLKANGITVDDKSPNTLRANSFLMSGPTGQYTLNGQHVSVTQKLTGYTVTLSLGAKEIWKDEFTKPPEHALPPLAIAVQIKPGETAQQAADRQYAQNTASAVIPPSMYIFRERSMPDSTLTARGVNTSGGLVLPGRSLRGPPTTAPARGRNP